MNDYSLDEEVVQAIFGILDIREDIDKYKEKTEKGERVNMCKAWDDHKERGRREGRQEEKAENLKCIMKNLKITIQQAMDILEIPETERSSYASLQVLNRENSKSATTEKTDLW